MLDEIISYKQDFFNTKKTRIVDIKSFISELSTFQSSNSILIDSEPYWKNYFHAALLSSFFECVGYDLINWNQYFLNCSDITKLFSLESGPSESDVLELFVLHSINHVFDFGRNEYNILALRSTDNIDPSFLTDDSGFEHLLTDEENSRIIQNLKAVMKIRGQPQKEVWGDNDVIVTLLVEGIRQQFCIISCKTSLRERVYQSIFWAMRSRLEGVGKHVFVTTDKGSKGKSEIGSRGINNYAKKPRDVLESTMDRVYVLRNESEVNRSQVIKDFLCLRNDLLLWAKDFSGYTII